MLIAGMRTVGISMLIMLITSFIGILFIRNVLLLSMVSLLFTYLVNGYLAARMYQRYPYFLAYMTALVLIVLNLGFSQYIIGMDVFLNPDTIFYSLIVGTILSLLGAFAKMTYDRRREAHA